jgi:hypothetical protein
MNLPNDDQAIVDIRKLLDYCLNLRHPQGRNKARVLASIGIREADTEELRDAILSAARDAEADPAGKMYYGQRYVVDFDFCREGRTVRIRSTWTARTEDGLPRLTSCYVL